MGTSQMKLLNRCKKYREKSIQLTIIISHTHAPLQLCSVAPLLLQIQFGVTLQSCSGAWVWLIIILVLSVVQTCPCTFTPVQQFHSTCPRTFYTGSTLYLLKFLEKFLLCLGYQDSSEISVLCCCTSVTSSPTVVYVCIMQLFYMYMYKVQLSIKRFQKKSS